MFSAPTECRMFCLLPDFIYIHSIGVPTGGTGQTLVLSEGVVFNRSVMPISPYMINENLEDIDHLTAVE